MSNMCSRAAHYNNKKILSTNPGRQKLLITQDLQRSWTAHLELSREEDNLRMPGVRDIRRYIKEKADEFVGACVE